MFENSPVMSSTMEGEFMTEEDIKKMVREQVHGIEEKKGLTLFEADFCNEYGIVCPFSMIHTILGSMEKNGEIQIIRDPAKTTTGKISQFWDEKGRNKVWIRRLLP